MGLWQDKTSYVPFHLYTSHLVQGLLLYGMVNKDLLQLLPLYGIVKKYLVQGSPVFGKVKLSIPSRTSQWYGKTNV